MLEMNKLGPTLKKRISTCIHIPTPNFKYTTEARPLSLSLSQNHYDGSLPNRLLFQLHCCSNSTLLEQCRQLHAHFVINGISCKAHVGSKLLGIYTLSDSFLDAIKLFYRDTELGYSMPWNFMIRGYVRKGLFRFALLFYLKMLGRGVSPDNYTFPSVIKACTSLNNAGAVRLVQDTILCMGLEVDAFVASSLIKFYAENDRLDDARMLFAKIPQKDCVLWNVMLNGHVKYGGLNDAIEAFEEMRKTETKPNSVTFSCVLSICASESTLKLGTQLHGLVVVSGWEFDSSVSNTLLAMYSKCRVLSAAQKLFGMMSQTDSVTWNSIISGYVQNGFMDEGSRMFREMIYARVLPDSITFSTLLPSLTESGSPKYCKEVHCYIIRHNVRLDMFLKSAFIDTYFKCRDVEMAQKVFNQCTTVDVVICTAMISGYLHNGMNFDALETFRLLLKERIIPNDITLASVLPACAGLVALKLGKELHASILKRGLDRRCHVGCALMDMYAKCGRMDLAYQIFGRMSERDTVSWNSMITSCVQNGKSNEAIDIFRQMGMSGAEYDFVSISAVLSACGSLPAERYGKAVHGFMIKGAFTSDVIAESAMIDMYAKCGNLDFARRVFETMKEKNEVSWNSIIAAYGNHGCLKDTLFLFDKMLENGIQPDHVTFLAIISACAHVGAVDDGIRVFSSMTKDYGIPAQMEHYGCMVDLFGRAGRLSEAFQTVKSMPFSPDAGVWGTLLGACRVHGNVELAKLASSKLFDLDPQNSGYYVLLSNIHANAGHWGNVLKIRSLMKERGVQKIPGYSWIEVDNATHLFVSADGSHPKSAQIYSLLRLLIVELKREGYAPQLYLPVHPRMSGITSIHKGNALHSLQQQ